MIELAKGLRDCPTCEGFGWVHNDGGLDFYGRHSCKDCFSTGKDIEQLLALAEIPKKPKPKSDMFWISVAFRNAERR